MVAVYLDGADRPRRQWFLQCYKIAATGDVVLGGQWVWGTGKVHESLLWEKVRYEALGNGLGQPKQSCAGRGTSNYKSGGSKGVAPCLGKTEVKVKGLFPYVGILNVSVPISSFFTFK